MLVRAAVPWRGERCVYVCRASIACHSGVVSIACARVVQGSHVCVCLCSALEGPHSARIDEESHGHSGLYFSSSCPIKHFSSPLVVARPRVFVFSFFFLLSSFAIRVSYFHILGACVCVCTCVCCVVRAVCIPTWRTCGVWADDDGTYVHA
jgi:hypothetical protein